MSYQALYRKYRPRTFQEVKGQDHIVTTLKNQIKAGRIGHAYLFCGTRGTGKTTVAKIFAKAVNCENPVDGDPCGECPSCQEIGSGNSMNVVEIDAASNNGVDNIRQIREEVTYAPTSGRYRVYIIDEVHMLSTGAFNALLKTLEEPPAYVIFILATTEVQKIPATILSRCQRYDFHRISIDTIAQRLSDLMQREHIDAEEEAIRYVAKAADGSMRDALSLLDQCISFYMGQKLTYDDVLDVLGAVDTEVFSRLLRRILQDDVAGALDIVEELIMQGRELGQFVTDFIWYLRDLLLIGASDRMADTFDMSTENLALLKEESQMLDADSIMYYIREFSSLSQEMRYATQKRVLLEIAIIRICRPAMEENQDALADRVSRLERKVEQGIQIPVNAGSFRQTGRTVPVEEDPENAQEKIEKQKILQETVPEDIKQIIAGWPKLCAGISPRLRPYLTGPQAVVKLGLTDDNKLLLLVGDEAVYMTLSSPEHQSNIEEALSRQTGKDVHVVIRQISGNDWQKTDDIRELMQEMIQFPIEVEDE